MSKPETVTPVLTEAQSSEVEKTKREQAVAALSAQINVLLEEYKGFKRKPYLISEVVWHYHSSGTCTRAIGKADWSIVFKDSIWFENNTSVVEIGNAATYATNSVPCGSILKISNAKDADPTFYQIQPSGIYKVQGLYNEFSPTHHVNGCWNGFYQSDMDHAYNSLTPFANGIQRQLDAIASGELRPIPPSTSKS